MLSGSGGGDSDSDSDSRCHDCNKMFDLAICLVYVYKCYGQ